MITGRDGSTLRLTIVINGEEVEAEIRGIEESLEDTAASTRRIAAETGAIVVGFSHALDLATSLMNKLREPLRVAEKFEIYNAVLRVMLGSYERAHERFSEIIEFAATTPFRVEQVVETANQLETVNRFSVETMEMLGDLAAASGTNIYTALSAYINLVVGRTGMAMLQFRNMLVTTDDFSKAIGRDIVGAGGRMTATVTEMLEALPQIIQDKNFAGLMEYEMNTLMGRLSNLGDAITRLNWQIGNVFLEDTKKLIVLMIEGLETLEKHLNTIIIIVESIVTIFGPFLAGIVTIRAAKAAWLAVTKALYRQIYRLWAAMLANPLGAVAVAIGALITAWRIYTRLKEESTKRALENAEASNRLIDRKISETRTNRNLARSNAQLIEQYIELNDISNRSEKQSRDYERVLGQLRWRYIENVDASGDLKMSTEELNAEVEKAKNKTNEYEKSLADLRQEQIEVVRNIHELRVAVAQQEIEKMFGTQSDWKRPIGAIDRLTNAIGLTSTAMSIARRELSEYWDEIADAESIEEAEQLITELNNKISSGEFEKTVSNWYRGFRLNEKQRLEISESFQGLGEQIVDQMRFEESEEVRRVMDIITDQLEETQTGRFEKNAKGFAKYLEDLQDAWNRLDLPVLSEKLGLDEEIIRDNANRIKFEFEKMINTQVQQWNDLAREDEQRRKDEEQKQQRERQQRLRHFQEQLRQQQWFVENDRITHDEYIKNVSRLEDEYIKHLSTIKEHSIEEMEFRKGLSKVRDVFFKNEISKTIAHNQALLRAGEISIEEYNKQYKTLTEELINYYNEQEKLTTEQLNRRADLLERLKDIDKQIIAEQVRNQQLAFRSFMADVDIGTLDMGSMIEDIDLSDVVSVDMLAEYENAYLQMNENVRRVRMEEIELIKDAEERTKQREEVELESARNRLAILTRMFEHAEQMEVTDEEADIRRREMMQSLYMEILRIQTDITLLERTESEHRLTIFNREFQEKARIAGEFSHHIGNIFNAIYQSSLQSAKKSSDAWQQSANDQASADRERALSYAKTQEEMTRINAHYERHREQIEQKAEDMMKEKMKTAFALQKAAQLANAIINTSTAVTGALDPIRFPPPSNFILAGIIAAAGAIEIAAISKQEFPGYKKGGLVELEDLTDKNIKGKIKGKSGDDKILVRLTDGEYVINKDATEKHLPLLEMINKGYKHGGIIGDYSNTVPSIAPQMDLSEITSEIKQLKILMADYMRNPVPPKLILSKGEQRKIVSNGRGAQFKDIL